MAQPAGTLTRTHHRLPQWELAPLVTAITNYLQTLNPQKPTVPKLSSSSPLNQFSRHLDTNLVIQVIQSQPNPHHALFFFNWSSAPCPNPTNYAHAHRSYVAITDLLLSHSLFSAASSLLEKAGKVSDLMGSKFILAHGRLGNIKGSIFWFHKVRELEKGKCLFCYNALLGVLVRANKVDLALSFFGQMLESGGVVKPDASSYTTMIRGLFKLGRVEEAEQLFDKMGCTPNAVTYNVVIDGFCKKGRMDKAEKVFREMVESNVCLPDAVTFTCLIDGCCKKGKFGEAMRWMNDMVMRGCRPNLPTYNAIVFGLCMRGNVDEAKKFLTKMRLNGLRENNQTRVSILKGLAAAGRLDEAIIYFKELMRGGLEPDAKVYDIVINVYCKMRKPNMAITLMEDMKVRGITPSVSSFNTVMRSLVNLGELDRAVCLLKQIPDFGGAANFISFSTVICGLCEAKCRMSEVETLVDIMLRDGFALDRTFYDFIIKGYCKDGKYEMAILVFYESIEKNYVIDQDTFSVLVDHLSRMGKLFEAKKLLEDMFIRCPVLDEDSYLSVIDEQLKQCRRGDEAT